MKFKDIPIPEAYTSSADFRFFVNWFSECLEKLKYDTENLVDLLDPERCPASLLWMLADTYGFKYDDRLPAAYNRLVLLYFMSMISNRGSKTGVTIGAEVNLAQFNIQDYAEEDPAYEDRLKDKSIPVNSVYVTSDNKYGYIDIVYYSEKTPKDVCLEYVRPLGMYCFTHEGVRVDSRTKISVDARLTDANNVNLPIGPTRVAHYRRADYASMQKMVDNTGKPNQEKRRNTYYRNSDSEKKTTALTKPGLRSLYSMQLCNNEHIVKSVMPSLKDADYSIFSLGYGPTDVSVNYPDNYLKQSDSPMFNLRYDEAAEAEQGVDVYTIDKDRSSAHNPRPAVNKPMYQLGEAMSLDPHNTKYTKIDESGKIVVSDD